jgi:hypothetical protein
MSYKDLFSVAEKEIKVADHLFNVTFPLVHEPKFFMVVVEHIIKSAKSGLNALLEYERHYKRIGPYHPSFSAMLSMYRYSLEKRYGFDIVYYRLLGKLMEVKKFNTDSKVRFKRGNTYVLAGEGFYLQIIDREKVKKYIYLTKNFINNVRGVLENESGGRG